MSGIVYRACRACGGRGFLDSFEGMGLARSCWGCGGTGQTVEESASPLDGCKECGSTLHATNHHDDLTKFTNALSGERCPVCSQDIPSDYLSKHVREYHPTLQIDLDQHNLGFDKEADKDKDKCPGCGGTGQVVDMSCPTCYGSGKKQAKQATPDFRVNNDPVAPNETVQTDDDTKCAECGHPARNHQGVIMLGADEGPCSICDCTGYAAVAGVGGIVQGSVKIAGGEEGPGICPECHSDLVDQGPNSSTCENCGSLFRWNRELLRYELLGGPRRPLSTVVVQAVDKQSLIGKLAEHLADFHLLSDERFAGSDRGLRMWQSHHYDHLVNTYNQSERGVIDDHTHEPGEFDGVLPSVTACARCDEKATVEAILINRKEAASRKFLCNTHLDIFKAAHDGLNRYKIFDLREAHHEGIDFGDEESRGDIPVRTPSTIEFEPIVPME